MTLPSRRDLAELLEPRQEPCISLYLPTHRGGKPIEQDPIRLKNALRQAHDLLVASGQRSPEIDGWLEPGQALVDNNSYWRHSEDGLALFLTPDWHRVHRLPVAVPELVTVGPRFHIKPLLPLLEQEHYFVLALSQNEVRLLRGTRYEIEQLQLEKVPESLRQSQARGGEELTYRSGTSAPAAAVGGRTGNFHGQPGSSDEPLPKRELQQFFLQVDRGLHEVLRDERAPLVLAGVEYLLPIYREATSYAYVIDEPLRGNPELLRPDELRQEVLGLVEPVLQQPERDTADRLRQALGTGRATTELRDVLRAAREGRVDSLFVALDAHVWGKQGGDSPYELELQRTPTVGSEDLLDLAAFLVLGSSGRVFAVPRERVPERAYAAALLRY